MKKIFFLSLYLLLVAMITTSCKKYENGPYFDLKSTENRIVGRWYLYEKYVYQSDEKIELTNEERNASVEFFKISENEHAENQGDFIWRENLVTSPCEVHNIEQGAIWHFYKDHKNDIIKNHIIISYYLSNTTIVSDEYIILRLTKDELWLKHSDSGIDVEYHYKSSNSNLGYIPDVSTTDVSAITQSSVSTGGYIYCDFGSEIIERGVCWSKSENPTINDNKTNDGIGTGSFSSSINGLSQGSTYYVRAYATNINGTSYGNTISFVTL